MDWRGMPPLSALRAFSAFAGSSTLEEAGARIGVTHAAVSQQIRALERHLGLHLVEKGGRRLSLTEEGRQLASALDGGFGMIRQSIATLMDKEAGRPLRLTATPAFASGWLLPLLPDFRAKHPSYDLTIDPSSALRRVGEEVDVAIRYGNGDWPGVSARCLLETPVVAVASVTLVPLETNPGAEDLAALPWLQEFGTNEATAFLESFGITRRGKSGLVSLPGNMMLDAARDGQGVAVIPRAFVEADIAAGRLRVLYEDHAREGYFLVTTAGPQRASVKAFCDWILRQTGTV